MVKGGIPEGVCWFNLLWHWQDVTPLCLMVQGGNYNTELQVLDWRGLLSSGILGQKTRQAGISL